MVLTKIPGTNKILDLFKDIVDDVSVKQYSEKVEN